MKPDLNLTDPQSFTLGVNYWAAHAGTAMWADWRADVVDADFARLAATGVQVLRAFPLWPDFQPIALLRTGGGAPAEIRHGEQLLPDDEAGQAGMSATAIEHFAEFCGLARKHGLRLVVGLITGWMSGRLFVPPALEGHNPISDPLAILWELRFVRYFVRRFQDEPAIVAWDLGNECNVMGRATREEAYVWTSAIVDAIRAIDPERPIVSGMHGLSVGPTRSWTVSDQAELTDLLTTHPYPVFTPHCDQDPLNTIRACLHATAESRLYADVGGKPCLCEEIGTLGPMIASERIAADFIRTNLFSLWANDCHGLFWWCANEQVLLSHAPYDWHAVERELGLFRVDGTPKLVAGELAAFRRFLQGLPFPQLPLRTREAVCILSDGQDQWGVAYSSFVLAKQAGLDLEFQYETQPLKDSSLYLLPCISGHRVICRHRWLELMERVKAGATLYISHQDGLLSPFEEITGLEVRTRQRRSAAQAATMDGLPGKPVLEAGGPFSLTLYPTRATVLGAEADGNPCFTCAEYGRGKVYFLTFPMEMQLTTQPGAFHTPEALPYWQVYRWIAREAVQGRAVAKTSPFIGATEHVLDERDRVVVLVNYSPEPVKESLTLTAGWQVKGALYGAQPWAEQGVLRCAVPANDAVALELVRP